MVPNDMRVTGVGLEDGRYGEGGRPVLQNETVRDDSSLCVPPSLTAQRELDVLRCVYTPGDGRGGGDTAPAGA